MIPFPDKKYSVIYADPPWEHAIDTKGNFRPLHYQRMKTQEICSLDVQSLSDKDSVLYLWTTCPHLLDGLEVMKAWGFTYKSQLIWVKKSIGLGHWVRNQHEILLIGNHGNMSPPEQSKRISSVFDCRNGRHSEKPKEIRHRITEMFPTQAKIELFARPDWTDYERGWDFWGNEV